MTGQPGWWRRNRWALLLGIPVFAVAGWGSWRTVGPYWWETEPRQVVSAGPTGVVGYAGARLRATKVHSVTDQDLRTAQSTSELPPGTRLWHVVLEVQPKALADPSVRLVDEQDRQYSPADSTQVKLPASLDSAGTSQLPPTGGNSWFLLPEAARPTQVRVWVREALPDYAALPVGAILS